MGEGGTVPSSSGASRAKLPAAASEPEPCCAVLRGAAQGGDLRHSAHREEQPSTNVHSISTLTRTSSKGGTIFAGR
jgi:hypothetical protein